jgi:hypothetical protein
MDDAPIQINDSPQEEHTMNSIKSRIVGSVRKASVIAALCATATTFAVAGPAHAQPIGNGSGSRGCPVEDEHGNVTYVPAGTVYLLWHCGADGEWHFGTVTNQIAQPKKNVHPIDTPPISPAARARLAKVQH